MLPRLTIAGLCILVLIAVTACSPQVVNRKTGKPVDIAKTVPQEKDEESVLEEKYSNLLIKVQQLEKQIENNNVEHDKQIRNMTQTIELLERNLIEIKEKQREELQKKEKETKNTGQSPKAVPKSNPQPQPQKTADKSEPSPSSNQNQIPTITKGLISEIKTPDTSKAIETVSLLPESKDDKKEINKSSKDDGDEEKIQIELDKKKNDKKNKLSPIVAEDFPDEVWEDPDLNESKSPIVLQVIPGAKRQYQKAFKIFSTRQYTESINEFQIFLSRFADDQDADNAQYWIGQAYYQQENYIKAEEAFRRVLKNYKHGDTKHGYKTPDSILMLGRIYQARKKTIKARYYFQQVIIRYPDSRSAAKARLEIQSMNTF